MEEKRCVLDMLVKVRRRSTPPPESKHCEQPCVLVWFFRSLLKNYIYHDKN